MYVCVCLYMYIYTHKYILICMYAHLENVMQHNREQTPPSSRTIKYYFYMNSCFLKYYSINFYTNQSLEASLLH